MNIELVLFCVLQLIIVIILATKVVLLNNMIEAMQTEIKLLAENNDTNNNNLLNIQKKFTETLSNAVKESIIAGFEVVIDNDTEDDNSK